MIRTRQRVVAFLLPFLIILPPILERIRGLHSPEVTWNVLLIAALFALPFAMCSAILNYQQTDDSHRTRLWLSVLLALCVFIYLDIGFGGIKIASQLLPFISQVSLLHRVMLHFAIIVLAVGCLTLLAWKMHKNILNTLFIMFGVIFVSTIFLPNHRPLDNWVRTDSVATKSTDSSKVEIYIIFDAMIGLNGIDREIPGGQEFYDLVRSFHERHGFVLYPNAFSRHGSTNSSIPSSLNYDFAGFYSDKYITEGDGDSKIVVSNRLFDLIALDGKNLTVYQTPFINYCQHEAVNECKTIAHNDPFNGYLPDNISERETFLTLMGIKLIAPETLTLTYIRLFLKNAVPSSLAQTLIGVGLVPELGRYDGPDFDLWFSEFVDDILASNGQSNYFAHFLLPHDPFVLDSDCKVKLEATGDMFITQNAGLRGREFEERRQQVYRDYFDQASCVFMKLDDLFNRLEGSAEFKDMTVTLSGDHGSRISAGKFSKYLRERDLKDNYSALFSIWQQGSKFESVEEQVSVQQLFSLRDSNFRIDPSAKIQKMVIAPIKKDSGQFVEISMFSAPVIQTP